MVYDRTFADRKSGRPTIALTREEFIGLFSEAIERYLESRPDDEVPARANLTDTREAALKAIAAIKKLESLTGDGDNEVSPASRFVTIILQIVQANKELRFHRVVALMEQGWCSYPYKKIPYYSQPRY